LFKTNTLLSPWWPCWLLGLTVISAALPWLTCEETAAATAPSTLDNNAIPPSLDGRYGPLQIFSP
jgi:hypothetical protein